MDNENDLDVCAVCQSHFDYESSKISQLFVSTPWLANSGHQNDKIISIYEALSVVFEIPALIPNGSNHDGEESKEAVFERASEFKPKETAYFLCAGCSDNLKDLYNKFQEFVQLCKKESIVGGILKSLETLPTFEVKEEPVEDESEEDGGLHEGDPLVQAPAVPCVKAEPQDMASEDESNTADDPNSPVSDVEDFNRDHTRTELNDENVLPAPTRRLPIKIPFADGVGVIKTYKCSTCSREFLHENTLICHRRIVHREKIKLLPPALLPRMKITKSTVNHFPSGKTATSSCPICRMTVLRSEIRVHLSNHTRSPLNKSSWLCTVCGKSFTSSGLLNAHSASAHQSGIPCKRCGIRVPTLQLLVHLRKCMQVSSGSYQCQLCDKSFQTNNSLSDHRALVHGQFWKCKLCGIKFTERLKMASHMASHKQKKLFKCKICDKSFDRGDVLRLHVKRFHRNGPPSVAPPSVLPPSPSHSDHFEPPDQENSENATEHGSGSGTAGEPKARFHCKPCGVTFSNQKLLDGHLSNKHTDSKSNKCLACNCCLKDEFHLKLHMRAHGDILPLECPFEKCDKTYKDKTSFFYHLKDSHGMTVSEITSKHSDLFRRKSNPGSAPPPKTPSKPREKGEYPCEICGKVFALTYSLQNHIRMVHEKVRNYLCKYCGKAFARKSYFNIHEKLHTSNEEPYKCHLCGKGFRLPGGLKVHLNSTIHSTARDHVCDICGKGFNRKENLRLHVNSVHLKIRKMRDPATQDRWSTSGRHRIYNESHDDRLHRMHPVNEPVAGTSHSAVPFHDTFSHSNEPTSSPCPPHSNEPAPPPCPMSMPIIAPTHGVFAPGSFQHRY